MLNNTACSGSGNHGERLLHHLVALRTLPYVGCTSLAHLRTRTVDSDQPPFAGDPIFM